MIEYAADGEDWTTAQELDQRLLPFGGGALFESETFTVPAGTSFVRFTVNKSRRSSTEAVNATSNGHAYFVVSEMGLATYSVTSNPIAELFPADVAADVMAALKQCRDAEVTLNASNSTPVEFDNAAQVLQPHYDTLLQIKNTAETIDIERVAADRNASKEIFDLQGRRVKDPAVRGVYIVGGKKAVKGSAD